MNELLKITLLLVPVGILAGIVSTIAGLASLVSYPVLLSIGIPPVTANVTNTVALVFTGVGSAVSSRRELKGHQRELLKIMPLTIIGCITGALLLFAIPASTFQKVVPFFILCAGILVLMPRHIQTRSSLTTSAPADWRQRWLPVLAWIGVFLVGTYTGYFGAAGGVLMLSMLSVISEAPFAEYNAEKNVALGAANCVSAIVYALHTPIHWEWALPLGIGFLVGGLIGPMIVRRVPAKLLKIVIGIGAIILAISLFIQAYF